MASTEPDELYTLRAQYWLGHYTMALEEAKNIVRRPMSPELKLEREEFMVRSQLALGQYQKVIQAAQESSTPSIRALGLAAQYDQADEASKQTVIGQVSSLLGDGVSTSVQLIASQIFLKAGMKREALQCVHLGLTMEHIVTCLQLYIQLDRLDLASQQLSLLRQADEDSVLTQLGTVYVALATGSSMAKDAAHTLNQLSEQYGPSVYLVNLMSCALMSQGLYGEAEAKLEQARQENLPGVEQDPNLLVNLMVCYQYQSKPTATLLQQVVSQYPNHFLSKGLETVNGAFDRESMKYRVS